MSGQGFEWTPSGPVPIGTAGQFAHGDAVEASVVPAQGTLPGFAPSPGPVGIAAQNVAPVPGAALPLTPRSLVRLARERVRAIKVELRRLRGLETELAELESLIAAAKRGAATVRHITTARRAG